MRATIGVSRCTDGVGAAGARVASIANASQLAGGANEVEGHPETAAVRPTAGRAAAGAFAESFTQ